MLVSTHFSRQDVPPLVSAIVRSVHVHQLTWNRPVFKAPPLEVKPPMADVLSLAAEVARFGRADR